MSLRHQPVLARRDVVRLLGTLISHIRRPNLVPLALIVTRVSLALWRLDAAPRLWWDEGWTLCDARSWVELGRYGCLLAGEPGPSNLSAAFPVVAPIALSFKLFGVGIWQARMVGVLFTAGTLALVHYLATKLYNRPVAIGTLAILLIMPNSWLHPVFVGKQVLSDVPALFYLLAGYTCFFLAERKPFVFLPLVLGFWGIALVTKVQVRPFWTMSLVVPLIVVLHKRRWRAAGLLAVGLVGSYGAFRLLPLGIQLLLSGHTLSRAPVSGLYQVTALVLVPTVRLAVLKFSLAVGLPTLLGLGYATWKWGHSYRKGNPQNMPELVRLMLLILAGSWFAWDVLLSVGSVRYLFPAVFLATLFAASLLYDLTGGFDFPPMIRAAALALKTRQSRQQAMQVIGVILLLTITSVTVILGLRVFSSYLGAGDTSAMRVARFFNTATPADTLIETWESELFVFLDRPYHFPPAQFNVDLLRRAELNQDVPLDYDPLPVDPGYLVINLNSQSWRLYEQTLASGAFRLLQTHGLYEIYERVR